MKTLEESMDYGFASHVVLWVVGAISLIGGIGAVLAFWSLGRAGYRKE
jgi:hypothetical protein